MSKPVLVIKSLTGPQTFTTSAEYSDFTNALINVNPHLTSIKEYNDNLKQSQILLLQEHTINEEDNSITTSKTFATEEAALSYKEWITQGEGKLLTDAYFDPLGWSITNTVITYMTDEQYETLIQA